MSTRTHAVLTSSAEPNWRTPEWLRAALRREFDIALDAAADMGSSVAPLWLGPGSPYGIEDALAPLGMGWGALVLPVQAVFCNPPYSRVAKQPITPWVAALAKTGADAIAIGVLPYASQTQHWRRYVVGGEYRATEIRLFPFRVAFDPPPGYSAAAKNGKTHGANVNTAVVIWRPTADYPRTQPWAPLQRYWVPAEYPDAEKYLR